MIQLQLAIDRLRSARGRIVAVAADWQAQGVETASLTPALIDIQDALAELEGAAQCYRAAAAAPATDAEQAAADGMRPLLVPNSCRPA